MNTVAINIYIITVLETYVTVQSAMDAALRKLAPVPGMWVAVRDPKYLKASSSRH